MPHGLQWIDFISDICFPIWGVIVIIIMNKLYTRMGTIVRLEGEIVARLSERK